jgi:predicted metal-dependent enzyme (double-stranded beta helix superfamily)
VGCGVTLGATGNLAQALRDHVALRDRWSALVHHDPDERGYGLLHRDEALEVYVVSWMAGHDTGFHDHGDSAAAIAVVAGAIYEERLSLAGPVGTMLSAGDLVTIGPEAIHCVRHFGSEPSVSIHAYSPPLERLGSYDVASDGALLRRSRAADVPLRAAA